MSDSTPQNPALVVASHRVPSRAAGESDPRRCGGAQPAPGGLSAALEAVLWKRGGSWIGLTGERPVARDAGAAFEAVPIALDADAERRFHHATDGALWPLFHSLPERAHFDPVDWEAYREVNARFAGTCARRSAPGGLVWIHDLHLMLAPDRVRRVAPEAAVLFFLHVPFPAYDLFTLAPNHEEILRGMLGSRLIGFHTASYVTNFLDCVERCLDAEVDRCRGHVRFEGRTIRVGAFPIGVDFAAFEAKALAAAPLASPRRDGLILGADRLDYTKGIPQRIRVMERLLERHPEHQERVTLVQVAVPSRSERPEYQRLKSEIDELVGRVNGRFASDCWSPIRYLCHHLHHDELASLYRDARVALVTPLRDGMNLVAKEFVACQVAEPGALVLSRLAGAAETMPEALLVNPWDLDGTAEALHRALTMSRDERATRMQALRTRESEHDVHAWADSLMRAARAR